MAEHIQTDQSQFSELLYKSVIMNKDKNRVIEKVLNLTLEIICLLTGEDSIMVKNCSKHADDIFPGVSEEYRRALSCLREPSPNSLTHNKINDQTLHPSDTEHVAVYLSMEERKSLEEGKAHYKDVMEEKRQTLSSLGCENVNPEMVTKNKYDSKQRVGDHQDPQQKRIHTAFSADESCNRNSLKRSHILPYPEDCMAEENRIIQDYQVAPGGRIIPQQCKQEDIPTEISTGESSSRNNPGRCHVPTYSKEYTEDDDRITQDYPIEPGDGGLSQRYKVEEIPTEMNTGESSNITMPERCHIPAFSQYCTEEDNRIPQDYQIEPGDQILPPQCKEEEIPIEISTAPECILNDIYAIQNDDENLLCDIPSRKTLNNRVTILDTDINSHEELHLTDSHIKQTGIEYSSSLVKKYSKTDTDRIQENEYKHRAYERNIINELDFISPFFVDESAFEAKLRDQKSAYAYGNHYPLLTVHS
ncbi:uncharacterized protein WCC33_001279 [Rhinophrynus dorsalis]